MYGPPAEPLGSLGSGAVKQRYAPPVSKEEVDQRVPMTAEEILELVRLVVSTPQKKSE